MKQSIYYLLAGLFLMTACNMNKTANLSEMEVIPIDNNLSDEPALKNIRYIKLETSDECLLENVQKVIVYNEKIYILSSVGNGNVYVFLSNGQFVTKFNKGEGPEDIMYPTDIAIHEENGTLAILDTYRNIKEFNLDDYSFYKKTSFENPYFALEIIGKDILLFDPNSQSKSDYYLYNLTEDRKMFRKPFKGKFFSQSNFFTKINKQATLVSCIFSDTIFHMDSQSKTWVPYFLLDTKGKRANLHLDDIHSLAEYTKMIEGNDYLSGVCDFSLLNDKLFFSLKGKQNVFVTYEKGKSTIHHRLFQDFPNIYTSSGRTDKEVIFAIDMPWLMEYFEEHEPTTAIGKELKEKCTDENDNPVLLLASF